MKGKERPEDVEFNMADWMRKYNRELPESPAAVRCWQPGEVEVEDRWGIGSVSSRSEPGCAPGNDRFDILKKSKSRQLHGSRRSLHGAGRRVFLCFRRSTINLTVRDLEPSTPPKSGPLTGRTSVSGPLNGVNTFMDDAIDHHHHHTDSNKDGKNAEEPTSPVVNCMGKVKNKKVPKHAKKTTEPVLNSDMDRFRRTKSQAPRQSPPRVQKSTSCKWKQLLRSNSSSISPSNHPIECEGEPEIDLGRFSSASGSSDPFYCDGPPKPDKTCMFMQRNNNNNNNNSNSYNNSNDNNNDDGAIDDDVNKLFQEQMDARNAAEPVQFRNLPKLKIKPIESPKWLEDEPALNRRLHKPSRIDIKRSSTRSSSHT